MNTCNYSRFNSLRRPSLTLRKKDLSNFYFIREVWITTALDISEITFSSLRELISGVNLVMALSLIFLGLVKCFTILFCIYDSLFLEVEFSVKIESRGTC